MSATEYRSYELYCNSPERHDDPSSGFFDSDGTGTRHITPPAKLRALAAKAGWTHVRSPYGRKHDKDYCPEHKPVTTTATEDRP